MPEISILMSVRNNVELLEDSIQKILNQSFTDFELWIIDNLSNEEISLIMSFNDSRINLINLNIKHKFNINRIARCEYILIIDSNTIIHSDFLKIQLKRMKLNPEITVCMTWLRLLKENVPIPQNQLLEREIENPILSFLCKEIFISSPFIIKKSFLTENKLDKYDLQNFNYIDFWFKIAKQNGVFFIEPQYLSNYRLIENKEIIINKENIKDRFIKSKKEMIYYLLEKTNNSNKLKRLYNSMERLEKEGLLTSDNIFQFFVNLLSKKKKM